MNVNRKSLKSFLVYLLLVSSCQKNDTQTLAVIGGEDTVTVRQFKTLIENEFEKSEVQFTQRDKSKILRNVLKYRLSLLYAKKLGLDTKIDFDVEKMQQSILSRKAYDENILGHFITDEFLQEYAGHFDMSVKVQNLFILFKEGSVLPGTITREQAKERADSIFSKINGYNFNSVAEQFSDYKDPVTQRGSIVPEDIQIGKMPFLYEKEIFKMSPGMISRPVEIQGAFVIIHMISKDKRLTQLPPKSKIYDVLKIKLKGSDYFLLRRYQNQLLDSLSESLKLEVFDNNIRFMTSRLKDSMLVAEMKTQFSEVELEKELARFKGGSVTIRQLLGSFEQKAFIKLSIESLRQIVHVRSRDALMVKMLTNQGYLESEEFRQTLQLAIERKIIEKLKKTIEARIQVPSKSMLKTFYEQKRERYFTQGSMVISEIFANSLEEISNVKNAMESGIGFEFAAQAVRSKQAGKSSVTFLSKSTINNSKKNELVAAALWMKVNEISGIIPRKEGGYSIIKLIDKQEPKLIEFEMALETIKNDYINSQVEKEFLSLSREWPIIVYENNLAGI